MTDFAILHPAPCSCFSRGYELDIVDAAHPCDICDYDLGVHVPITLYDGRLTNHLSCEIAATLSEVQL